ncbi:M10 family metallopeptidase C-terminal domain-containing protein [Sulfitobacter sp.]|uniref:M10 family metallopeptidase C-terminal domain-containing protein n=1 Tax=Sulfitobacter sp. TaxID=1903071 RepID=UPI003003A1CB
MGGTGHDLLVGSAVGNVIDGGAGDDEIYGIGGGDILRGGADQIFGFDGQDDLIGMQGNDTLVGGQGSDELTGGGGSDRFVFNLASESTFTLRDTIKDFGVGGADVVDLSAIDANTGVSGNQIFNFVGSSAFANAGDLRFVTNGIDGYILGDVDGNGATDLNILLLGVTSMSASDFDL